MLFRSRLSARKKMEEKNLNELLEREDFEGAAECALRLGAEEFAKVLAALNEKYLQPLCRALDSDFLAETLILLDAPLQSKIISTLRDDELQEVMDGVSVDDTVEMIGDMPEKIVRRIAEKEEIVRLFEERRFSVLKPLLSSMNAPDVAAVFEEVEDEDLPVLFRILPKDLAADTFVEMDKDTREKLLHKLSDLEVKAVMDELFVDDTVDVIEEMPANVVKRLLAASDKETRDYVNEILKYPKDSAGSIMTVEYVSLRPTMTVSEAFSRIRRTAIDKETIYTCYVTDAANKLIGCVSAKTLMISAPETKISDIMDENVIYAHTEDDREDVARKISNYGFLALPVVDNEQRLVGIVTEIGRAHV